MKDETRKLILEAIKEEFRAMNLPDPEEALIMRREGSEGKTPTQFNGYEIGLSIGLWQHIEADLNRMPELTDHSRQEVLSKIRGKIRYMVRDAMLHIAHEMPHRSGGRPAIAEELKKKAVQLVGYLMGEGDTYPEAVTKAALRFDMSEKTIQRAWQKAHRRDSD